MTSGKKITRRELKRIKSNFPICKGMTIFCRFWLRPAHYTFFIASSPARILLLISRYNLKYHLSCCQILSISTWRVNNNKVTLFLMTADDLCQESLFDECAKHLKEEAILAMQIAQQYFSGL
jgi:hypothetical protein